MKLLFLLLTLLVAFYLFCLLGKLWLLSKRKALLHRTVFKERQAPMPKRLVRKKRRERF